MAQTKVTVREAIQLARVNIALVIVGLVGASVLVMAGLIVMLSTRTQPRELHSIQQQLINPAGQPLLNQPVSDEDLQQIRRVLRQNWQDDTASTVLLAAPLVAVGTGVIAYGVARRLVRPIYDSYHAQERFLQDAAHELRNPLAAIKVTLQSFKAKDVNKLQATDITKLTNALDKQVSRLININEDLLFLDKAGRASTNTEINASELTKDVIEDLQSLATAKHITVLSDIEDDVKLKMPSEDYVRLVRNVLSNAIKYSTDSSEEVRLSLSSSKRSGRVRLSVRDFGVGIPEDELHHIGRRFYRASNTSIFEGTGLGMAMVQKIVSAYGGIVTIKSQEGEGTHVVVNL